MQPKQPKTEQQAMSEYGEPWRLATDQYGWVFDRNDEEVRLVWQRHRERAIACVNALAGIPNPESVRELVEAARAWVLFQENPTSAFELRETDERLTRAVEALTAPSAGAQQK